MKNIKKFEGFLNEGSGQMKEYILVRFGNGIDRRVTEVLSRVSTAATATGLPGTIITLFKSAEQYDVIKSSLEELGIKFELIDKTATIGGTASERPSSTTRSSNPESNEFRIETLKRKLKAAVKADKFEEAAKLRDQIIELGGTITESETSFFKNKK